MDGNLIEYQFSEQKEERPFPVIGSNVSVSTWWLDPWHLDESSWDKYQDKALCYRDGSGILRVSGPVRKGAILIGQKVGQGVPG